jgi:hypothetical protein
MDEGHELVELHVEPMHSSWKKNSFFWFVVLVVGQIVVIASLMYFIVKPVAEAQERQECTIKVESRLFTGFADGLTNPIESAERKAALDRAKAASNDLKRLDDIC